MASKEIEWVVGSLFENHENMQTDVAGGIVKTDVAWLNQRTDVKWQR
jgi:hypothetical protein